MQMSSSAINLIKNTSKDTTSMIKYWFGTVPNFKKMTGLIHGPRDWQWQIPGGDEEINGGHWEILGLQRGKCQKPKHRACLEKTVKVSGNTDIETGSQATKIAPQNDIIPAKDAFNMS